LARIFLGIGNWEGVRKIRGRGYRWRGIYAAVGDLGEHGMGYPLPQVMGSGAKPRKFSGLQFLDMRRVIPSQLNQWSPPDLRF